MEWIEPDSSNHFSDCGTTINTWEDMLDGIDFIAHLVTETHFVVLDMGSSLDISRVGLRGNTAGGQNAPTAINIYVSDDTGDWGTAVATGIDPSGFFDDVSWLDTITTRKDGRYVKIEITDTQSGVLAWGETGLKMIRIWTGDVPKKYTTIIPMRFSYDNNFSTTFNPTDGRRGIIPIDGSKYNNIVSVVGMGTGKRAGTSGGDPAPSWVMQAYDRTNSQEIVQLGNAGEVYSTAISNNGVDNFPSGAAFFDVRYRQNDAISSQNTNFELHITQETNATGNKTVVYIPLASHKAGLRDSYSVYSGFPLNYLSQHQFKYNASDWDCTIDKVYFTTTIRANTGNTVSIKLDTGTAGSGLAEHTNNTTSYVQESSADIKGDLVDGTTYDIFVKSTANNNVGDIISNAYLVFEISDMNAFPTFQDVGIIGKSESATTGWQEDISQQVRILDNDTTYFSSNITRVLKHQAVVKIGFGADSMGVSVYDDGTRISAADLTTSNTTVTLLESGAITPADASDITFGWNLQKSFLGGGTAMSSVLIRYMSGFDLAPPVSARRIFIM